MHFPLLIALPAFRYESKKLRKGANKHQGLFLMGRHGPHALLWAMRVLMLVGAMSLVTTGMEIPAGKLVMGQPARVVRDVSDEEKRWMSETVDTYASLAVEHARGGRDG